MSNPVFLTAFNNGVSDLVAVLPGTKQFPSGLSDHPMTQGADIPTRDDENTYIKEPDFRRRFSRDLLHNPESIWALNLISESLSVALIDSGPLIPLRGCLVPASLQIILHPIVSGWTPDKIESIFIEIKEDRIANHIAIMVARNKLLGLIDFEVLKAIDAEIGEQFEGVRTVHIKIGHVVRLVEKSAGFLPCTLFISPVRKLGTHHRKGIRSYLRITQQFDWIPDSL